MAWRGEHRVFVVEEYIRNGGSVTTDDERNWDMNVQTVQ
jgi:hypothetical protein